MNSRDLSSTERSSVKKGLFKAGACLALAIGIVVYLFVFSGRERPSPQAPTPALTVEPSISLAEKRTFFEEQISPHIARNHEANMKALLKFKEGIHNLFEGYRTKVPVFVEKITGWSNKVKIMWKSARQIGSDDKRQVERHVTESFNVNVVSAEQIRADLEKQVLSLRQDIEANRNEMLAAIDAAVSRDPRFDFGEVALSRNFMTALDKNIKTVSTQAGMDSMVLGGMSLVAGIAVEEAVRILTTSIFTRVATSLGGSMAATATTAGGTTLTSAAGGGATGTLAGPVGVAVGVGAGLIFGGIVDWFMTNRLEEKLNTQCKNFLTATEMSIISDAQGLVSMLAQALAEINKATAPILRKQLGIWP